MEKTTSYAQLYLRIALGIGYLLAVLDRFGAIGNAGAPNVAWGNWENFVAYTRSLLPFVNETFAVLSAWIATGLEIVIALLLIIGYKTRIAAFGSFALTLLFAMSMFLFSSYRAPFTYSVFVCSSASLVLAGLPYYAWSFDHYAAKRYRNK